MYLYRWIKICTRNRICETRHKIIEKGNKVILIWIPGHIGIPGNGKANRAAKQAANSQPTTNQTLGPLMEDLIKEVKKHYQDGTRPL
ncbi:hypothetical protein ANTPLA_LOCUS585 [Anthophora plagiata]